MALTVEPAPGPGAAAPEPRSSAPATPPAPEPGAGVAEGSEPAPAAPAAPAGPSDLEKLQQQHQKLQVEAERARLAKQERDKELEKLRQSMQERDERDKSLREDPIAALREYGHSYDSATQRAIESDKGPPSATELEVASLKDTVRELQDMLQGNISEQQKRQAAQQDERRHGELLQTLRAAEDDYAALLDLGHSGAAYQSLRQEEERLGYELTPDEAKDHLRKMEETVRENLGHQVMALARRPWARELFQNAVKQAANGTEPADEGSTDEATERRPARTARPLNNRDASESLRTTASDVVAGDRRRRAAERVRANRAARGE